MNIRGLSKQTILEMIEGKRSTRQHEVEELKDSCKDKRKVELVMQAAHGETKLNELCVRVGEFPRWRIDVITDFTSEMSDDTVLTVRLTELTTGAENGDFGEILEFQDLLGEFPSEGLIAKVMLLAG